MTFMESKASDILARIQNREALAFDEFHAKHGMVLFNFALHYCGSRDKAQDLLQEIYCRFLKSVWSGLEIREPLAYLMKSLRREALRRKSREEKMSPMPADEFLIPKIPAFEKPEDKIFREEKQAQIWQSLQSLPGKNREVLKLHIYQEMTFEKISEFLEEPLSTILSRYYKGMELFEKALPKHLTKDEQ